MAERGRATPDNNAVSGFGRLRRPTRNRPSDSPGAWSVEMDCSAQVREQRCRAGSETSER